MNRTPLALAGSFLLAIALAACGSTAERGATGTPATPSLAATAVPPSPSPQVRVWGAGAAVSYAFGSFAEWARDAVFGNRGVTLVRIVEVSGVRWSTASGEGPGPADIARASRGEVEFAIGRLVTVELDRILRGTWPARGPPPCTGSPVARSASTGHPTPTVSPTRAPVLSPSSPHGPAQISTPPAGSCGSMSTGSSRPTPPDASGPSTPTRRSA